MKFFRHVFDQTFTNVGYFTKSAEPQEALIQLLSAKTWSDSQLIVAQNSNLMGDQTEALLNQLLVIEEKEDIKRDLYERRALLRRCREIGIRQAFYEHVRLESNTLQTDISEELSLLLSMLSQPDKCMDIPHRIELCKQALAMVEQGEQPKLWAGLQLELGNHLCQNPAGNREENIECAIAVYRKVLTIMTPKKMPIEWAKTMNNLGNAYTERIRGDKEENVEQAIMIFLGCLSIMTRDARPLEWARTTNNLAFAYINRLRGDRADNIEDAILACQEALSMTSRETMLVEWVKAMNNLATAYRERMVGSRSENIEYAIATCQEVLNEISQEDLPTEWNQTMNNLACLH